MPFTEKPTLSRDGIRVSKYILLSLCPEVIICSGNENLEPRADSQGSGGPPALTAGGDKFDPRHYHPEILEGFNSKILTLGTPDTAKCMISRTPRSSACKHSKFVTPSKLQPTKVCPIELMDLVTVT